MNKPVYFLVFTFLFGLILQISVGQNCRCRDIDFRAKMQKLPFSAKYSNDSLYIWGASLVKSESDGKYHLFYSQWPRKLGMKAWVTNSEIAHAVADSPTGPFKFSDVSLPSRGKEYWDGLVTHNPTVHYFDGKYYLYYMGTTGTTDDREYWSFRNLQRIGVAVAESPFGPWKRSEQPLINVSADTQAHDGLMVSNPSVTKMSGGKYLMVYKAVSKRLKAPGYGPVVHLTAISGSPDGPFQKQMNPVFTVADTEFPAEDPYVWNDGEQYFAIVKDMNGAFTSAGRSLVLFCSVDGLNWKLADHPLVSDLNLKWEDGTVQKLHALERPQLLFENGKPSVLLCAVNITLDHSFNVQIPLE